MCIIVYADYQKEPCMYRYLLSPFSVYPLVYQTSSIAIQLDTFACIVMQMTHQWQYVLMQLLLRCVRYLLMAGLALHCGLLVAKSISTQLAVMLLSLELKWLLFEAILLFKLLIYHFLAAVVSILAIPI